MFTIFLIVIFWLACAIFSTGAIMALFQHDFPRLSNEEYRYDLGIFLIAGILFGPIAAVVALFFSGLCAYGWTLLPPKE